MGLVGFKFINIIKSINCLPPILQPHAQPEYLPSYPRFNDGLYGGIERGMRRGSRCGITDSRTGVYYAVMRPKEAFNAMAGYIGVNTQ